MQNNSTFGSWRTSLRKILDLPLPFTRAVSFSVSVKFYHCSNDDGPFYGQNGFGTHSVRQYKFDGTCKQALDFENVINQNSLTAFTSLLASLLVFAALVYAGYPVSSVYQKFMGIATAAMMFSFVLSVLLYIKSLGVSDHQLAANSGA